MINIIASALVIGAGIILCVRLLIIMGFNIEWTKTDRMKQTRMFESTYKDYTGKVADRAAICKVAAGALAARIVVYLSSAVAMRMYMAKETVLTFKQFVTEWTKWDAANYLRIATLGYKGYMEGDRYTTLVFFPLYSWLIRLVNTVVRYPELSAMVVSTICFVIGCCFLYAVVSMEYGKTIATKTITYLTVFPFAFFFGSMMPESTFFMMICMCLYAVKKHNWMFAGICGIFASLARMQGVLMMIPLIIEWLELRRPVERIKNKETKGLAKQIFTELIWAPVITIGSFIYLGINYKITGDAFKFLEYQKDVWGQEAQWFGVTIEQIWFRVFSKTQMGNTRFNVWLPELLLFFIIAILIIYGIGKVNDKYLVFLLAYLVMNYLPTWLLSGGRYMTVAVPLFIILSVYSEKHKWADKWIIGISMLLYGVYMYGFLTWQQIM